MGEPRVDILNGKRYRIEQGDCLDFMAALPEQSVDLVFCSPPYEMARLYLENGENLSIARNTEEWVAWMVEVVRASLRVCKGLCAFVVEGQTRKYRYSCGPVLLMADLHRAGVCLRKPPIYKRVGIPGSGGPDWLRNDYEFVVCATNSDRLPWSDNTACGQPPKFGAGGEMSYRTIDGERVNERRTKSWATSGHKNGDSCRRKKGYTVPLLANPGNVIECTAGGGNMGNALAHDNEAPFPEPLAEFFIRSFAKEGAIVADWFAGSGTTPAVAVRHNRRALACDLRQSQVDLTLRRIAGETPLALFADA